MPRVKSTEPLLKVKINLFAADYERMQMMYPSTGAGPAIRALVRSHVNKISRNVGTLAPVEIGDIDIDLEEEEDA
jgi:hypothetical protein